MFFMCKLANRYCAMFTSERNEAMKFSSNYRRYSDDFRKHESKNYNT